MPKIDRMKFAVLISGGGTTLRNLIEVHQQGDLHADISLVVSSNRSTAGNQYATDHEIALKIVERSNYKSIKSFSKAIFDHCRDRRIDLVVMAGFLKKVFIPDDFENRVVNIHPSLIPAFCGKGMYGMHVHRAVVQSNAKTSGCTVHFVDNEYDHGPIIVQRSVEVRENDSPESLQDRVFATECDIYPRVINAIANNAVMVQERRVTVSCDL